MRDYGVELTERNYSKTPLTEAEVLGIVGAAGSVAAVLNTRHEIAKAQGWATTPPSPETFAAEAAKDGNLLRRPILITDRGVAVGKDPAGWARLLGT